MFRTCSGFHPIFTYNPFKVQMLLTLQKPYVMFPLTPQLCSFSCPSCGDVICGISCLRSLNYFSCGNVIYGTIVICLIAYTIVGTAFTIVGTIDGSTLPFIIFCAFKFVISYSLFTPKHEALPSSIMFFLLITLLGEFVATFFLFSNVVFISSQFF